MRLIDADALIDTLYDHEFASYIDKGEVSTVINDEPTVDAQMHQQDTALSAIINHALAASIGTHLSRRI